ncbi:MAG: hypothetical protein DHS20C17_15520 [Cyclobacteriaceae bacterium]|nr:MAG: hypothetical protein DHS20C17_15520 [Cyclobacteriaceae bacterium]
MTKFIRRISLTIVLLLGFTIPSWAQCAMCRASVENNISEGSAGLSAGLNTGIMYLFVTPYLMVALIGFLWYWKSKGKDARTVQTKINLKG